MSLRVTAGTLHGRKIPVPPEDVRPTSERARQAYFNIVSGRIAGARFLDLFAGSGIFSFEAVSRGAASAVAVDASRRNCAAIERLAADWNVQVKAIPSDVLAGMPRLGSIVFDLVYADPPYDWEKHAALLAAIDDSAPLAPDALIAIEHRRKSEIDAEAKRLRFVRRAEYGEVWISFWTRE